jgi:translation initiation factor IF-2
MPKKATAPTKVVEETNFFGDDAGFLSWLWIEVAAPKKQKVVQEEVVEEIVQEVATPTKTKKKASNDAEVVMAKEPLMHARIISKAPQPIVAAPTITSRKKTTTPPPAPVAPSTPIKTKQQASKEVDELIVKKSQAEGSPFARPAWNFGQGNRSGGGARFGQRRPGAGGRPGGAMQVGTRGQSRGAPAPEAGPKKEKTYKVSDSLKRKGTISMGDRIIVKEFSEKMGVPLPEVMKVLLSNKIIVGAQASIDFDTATLVAAEFQVTVERENAQMTVSDILSWNLQSILDQDKEREDLIPRPPIVTIMGHVDHGKTRLLDYLRKTNVLGGEAGGITQSIGASQIVHNDQPITFIDTPGHELFTSLRARGAKITNIVVIVVAVDDGLKPQTIEAINHAKEANVPIIVAITKIDLGLGKMDEIKWQLAEHGLQPEEWGGETMLVPVSAVTGQGINDLLDSILLQYELLTLRYSPSRPAVGVVVEANKDAKQGVTTSLLIMTGTLRVGDVIVIHNTFGRVRRMLNWKGEIIKEAKGGDPVVILGIQDLPEPGRLAEVVASDKEANKRIASLQEHEHTQHKDVLLQTIEKIGKGDKVQLKLILKADSVGSLEAIKHASLKAVLPETVDLKIIHTDVGSITDSDIIFAQASRAFVIWFNVTASGTLKKKATQMGVQVKTYDIIYEYIDFLDAILKGMIVIEKREVVIGKLEILGVFFRKGKDMVIGGRVQEGKVTNGAKFRVWRPSDPQVDVEGTPLPFTTGSITSLQKEQESVKEVREGHDCGLKIKVSKKLELWDILEFFVME